MAWLLPVAPRRIATWSTAPVEKKKGEKKRGVLVSLLMYTSQLCIIVRFIVLSRPAKYLEKETSPADPLTFEKWSSLQHCSFF